MGYTTKEELMEKVRLNNSFSENQIAFIENSIETHPELGNDIVLKLGTINEMEEMGILKAFYSVCKENCFFPQWIENVENGIDHI